MVGTLAGLQLKLHWRQMTSSAGAVMGSLVVLVLALTISVWGATELIGMRGLSVQTRGSLTVIGFAALSLLWPVAVTFLSDRRESLDAARFAPFPVRAAQLLPGLLVATAMGFGGFMTALLGIGYVWAWSTSPDTLLAALVGLLLGVATCLVSARALAAALTGVLRRRRGRELVMLLMVFAMFALTEVLGQARNELALDVLAAGVPTTLRYFDFVLTQWVANAAPVANVVAWTPFGWAWALPWAVASGRLATGLVWGGLALLWLGLMGWMWVTRLNKTLASSLGATGEVAVIKGANLLDKLLPATPAGAVAKRSLRYWRRDPRRLAGIITGTVVPMIVLVIGVVGISFEAGPDSWILLEFVPVLVSWLAISSIIWEISYDGEALAYQIAAGIRGRDDRLGRLYAWAVVYLPMQVAMLLVVSSMGQGWSLLPTVATICLAWLMSAAGVGAWMGAVWQVSQPAIGLRPPASGVRRNLSVFGVTMLRITLALLIGVPTFLFAGWGDIVGGWLRWGTLLVDVLIGALLLWWGVWAGGRRLDRTWPEVLARITWKG